MAIRVIRVIRVIIDMRLFEILRLLGLLGLFIYHRGSSKAKCETHTCPATGAPQCCFHT
jgi:hypothetical protein